ncbi:MAG TPA: 3-hydroxyanthranilate 3,4-dioxygenase [Candidatus Kapabacteria bacterium]|nr:3-hydroxyanthranilate 3,4-dioxygenase [Candidatus Kapabacteria bacterium]
MRTPFNLHRWIDEHRHLLKPPVGNDQLWKEEHPEFVIMVVGGPNARKDFHVDVGEEFFYQIEGDITLRLVEDGAIRDVPIRQGEVFLLAPNVPHSPQRGVNTVGLVIERRRTQDELDGFQWYCENCGTKLYEQFLHVSDITTQMKPVFDAFWGNLAARTCSNCGTVMQPPGM